MKYEVQAFYKNGAMAFHTWNIGQMSRDMEIAAARSRPDIGRVQWRISGGPGVWTAVQP